MKRYSNVPNPIQFEIQDLNGEYKVITAKSLSINDMQELTKMDKDKDPFESMKKQMAFVFGGKPEDYKNYDTRIIKQVILDYSSELQNPIVAQDQSMQQQERS